MNLGLVGKRAIVTGASRGIGEAIAVELAAEGCSLALVARTAEALAEVAARLEEASGAAAYPIVADLSTQDGPELAVAASVEALGGLDVLVNNAGASPFGSFDAVEDDAWREGFDLKLMGYIRCMRAALVPMREAGSGRIINIVGLAGRVALPGYVLGAYNAALLHLTKSVADHVAKDGIGIVAVNPGLTETDRMHDALRTWADVAGVPQPEFVEAYLSSNVPAGRFAQPEEIARVVAFLASDAAEYISGTSVFVDGASLKGF